ncbi:S24 family peptidase [Erwinia persicina]|uniref:Peptidase n=1 Tax=Erwinia persicina TaxID=55211 RepID=A0ABR9A0F1_9GAMM|nr:S24 family peptidase [Erwinia persicina]MBD8109457.1 peptidase [Erwinia persicina]MBD8212602.1 peptidase [Erwinia persicina]
MAFQSPAAGYAGQRISFGDLVHLSPNSTYILRSAGDYPDAGIVEGSLLAVDRGLRPAHGQIVIAEFRNELVLRRLLLTPAPALQELSGECPVTQLAEGEPLPVWGVVAYALTDLAGLGFRQMPE